MDIPFSVLQVEYEQSLAQNPASWHACFMKAPNCSPEKLPGFGLWVQAVDINRRGDHMVVVMQGWKSCANVAPSAVA